jgi:ketosteroid isomerase-like protein
MFHPLVARSRTLALILALFLAPVAAAQDTDLDARVASFHSALSDAWESGDTPALANLFAEDAIYWTPLGDTLSGRDAIAAWLAKLGKTADLAIETLHSERIGDDVFDVGNFVQQIEVDGKPITFRGGYATLVANGPHGPQMRRLISFPERKPIAPPQ